MREKRSAKVLATLREISCGTADDIAAAAALTRVAVNCVLPSLKRRGLVVAVGALCNSGSGLRAKVWRLATAKRAA